MRLYKFYHQSITIQYMTGRRALGSRIDGTQVGYVRVPHVPLCVIHCGCYVGFKLHGSRIWCPECKCPNRRIPHDAPIQPHFNCRPRWDTPGNSAWAWGTCHSQQKPKDLTGHQGFDSVTEVDGIPETFVLCEVWKFRSLVCAVRRTKVDLRPKLLGAKSQMGRSDTSGISMSSHPFVATMDPYGVWCWAFLRPIYIAIFIGRDLLIYSVESAHFDFCLDSQKETSQHRTLQVAIWFLMNDNWLLHTEYSVRHRELSKRLQPR